MKLKDKLKSIKNRIFISNVAVTIIKNSSWLVGNRIFTMIIGVFVSAMIARYFGPEKLGQFDYASSMVALLTVIGTLGLGNLTVKSLVDKEYDEGTIICTSFLLRLFGGIILTILATIIIRIIEPNDSTLQIIVLILSFIMIINAYQVIEYWIQAHHKAKMFSIIRVATYIVTAGLKIAVVFFNGNITHYALIFLCDAIILGAALIIAYSKVRNDKTKWRFKFSYAKSILSKSGFLILSGLMITLYNRIDQVMLGSMMPTTIDVGIYSRAVYISTLWNFVPAAIIVSFKPVIMAKKKIDQKSYLKSLQHLYTIVTWISIGFSIFILIFSNFIVSILYGPQFIEASNILTVNIWAGVFSMLGVASGVWLITENLQKYSVIFVASGAVINVVLNFFLIPVIGGYGAAIATLITQITVSIIVPLFFKKTRISSIMKLKAFMLKDIFNKKTN